MCHNTGDMSQSTDRLRRKARHLYAQGASVEDIAGIVDRSEKTVYRWRNDDEADWDELRSEAQAQDPHALLAELQSMRQRMVDECEDPAALSDPLWKLQRIIQSIRDEIGDVSTVMGVLEAFAEWSSEHASEHEREVLKRLAAEYTAELREENA